MQGSVIFVSFQICSGNVKAAVEKTFPFTLPQQKKNIDLSCQKSQISSTMSLKSQPQSSITSVVGENQNIQYERNRVLKMCPNNSVLFKRIKRLKTEVDIKVNLSD